MTYETLLTDLADGVMTVTLNRPDKLKGTSKNGPVIDLLSMAPDVSWVRRGLVSAISGFLPPDAQVGA